MTNSSLDMEIMWFDLFWHNNNNSTAMSITVSLHVEIIPYADTIEQGKKLNKTTSRTYMLWKCYTDPTFWFPPQSIRLVSWCLSLKPYDTPPTHTHDSDIPRRWHILQCCHNYVHFFSPIPRNSNPAHIDIKLPINFQHLNMNDYEHELFF